MARVAPAAHAARATAECSSIVLQLQLMNPNRQPANVLAPASSLRGVMEQAPADARAKVVSEGLLDVRDRWSASRR
jgi:hypothetical protein